MVRVYSPLSLFFFTIGDYTFAPKDRGGVASVSLKNDF